MSDQLQRNLDTAEIEEPLRPIFRYVRKLTLDPKGVGESDVAPIYDLGWSEHAVHDAARVCALINDMNRFVEGLGVSLGDGSDA